MSLHPSETLNNRYRIIKLLAQGGFGAVYQAWDLVLHKTCAVKETLGTSAELIAQFSREAATLENLAHPNLPQVIEVFSIPQRGQYLVMEFIEGENLEAKVLKSGPVDSRQAVYWIGQICDALDTLHNRPQPLIHRDIKPANVIITPEDQARLVDFGLVYKYDPRASTAAGSPIVTAGYSAPEQYGRGAADARSDIYSLGATLYTLLTGVIPAESTAVLAGTVRPPQAAHLLNPQVPARLSAVLQQAMQLDAKQRYSSAVEFKAALQASLQGALPSTLGEQAAEAAAGPAKGQVQGVAALPNQTPRKLNPTSKIVPAKPIRRSDWILFGLGGCLAGLILFLVAGLGLWALYTYTDVLAFLKPTQTPAPSASSPAAPTAVLIPAEEPTPLPAETLPLTPQPIYFDDFSDPNSGWDRAPMEEGVTDYQDGYYRILVNYANYDIWANPYLYYEDTIIEVDASWASGPYDNDFGVLCRYQDINNFYYAVISSDGYAAIIHMDQGSQSLLGTEDMLRYDAIAQGDALNHLRFDCVGETLSLYANGQLLITTTDSTLSSGDVGMIAGTFDEVGVEIHFDNFAIYTP